jgi:2-polyprenyl-6-methoxyphenol hydroxylase-like FAD-dependent oxidoreductase
MIAAHTPSVLIVGAGPTGLMLAICLQRAGVPYRLIDKAKGRNPNSRAMAVQSRTMELLDHYGLIDPFLEKGHRLKSMAFHRDAKLLGKVEFQHLTSRYPFLLTISQHDTETLLEKALVELGGKVERPSELLELRPRNVGAVAKIRDPEDVIHEIEYAYVVGCDGAHSSVRHSLGIEFPGDEYPECFALADLPVTGKIREDEGSVFFHSDGFVFFAPQGNGVFRIILRLHGDAARDGIDFVELKELLAKRVPLSLDLGTPTWLTTFRSHHRRAMRFRRGNVFLAGDAAHIHSPAGGQGMNTGIQDAINIGWKLAVILRGDAPPKLLDTYEAERLPVAEHVLNTTDRMLRMSELQSAAAAGLRDRLLSMFTQQPQIEHALARDLAQLSVHYRFGPISTDKRLNLFTLSQVWAGQRLPDFEVSMPDGHSKSIYDLVRGGGFQLFLAPRTSDLYGAGSFGEALHLARQMEKDFRGQLRVHWLLTPAQSIDLRGQLPDHYVDIGGVGAHTLGIEPCGVSLVRPDYYVAYADHDFSAGSLRLATLEFWT